MECSYIIQSGKFRGFKCHELAHNSDMCTNHHNQREAQRSENHMICCYTQISGDYVNYKCFENANCQKGICDRCCDLITASKRDIFKVPVPNVSRSQSLKLDILNEFCTDSNVKNLIMFLNKTTFTQDELRSALKVALLSSQNNAAATIMLTKGFFPETFGYRFLTADDFPRLSQNTLSTFFYKRFLIKTYILSFSPQLVDCVPTILDPHIKIIEDISVSKVKSSFHILLFPEFVLFDERIMSIDSNMTFDNTYIVINKPHSGQLTVIVHDSSRGLYRTKDVNFDDFIVKMHNGEIMVIGRLTDNGELVELSRKERCIANSLGLITHQHDNMNDTRFIVTQITHNTYSLNDRYILYEYKDRMYFINKTINNIYYDLNDNDILEIKSLIA